MSNSPEGLSEETRLLIERITKALVDLPNAVVITMMTSAHSAIFTICVAPSDVGKLIGKRGVHADALRRIIYAVSGKHRLRYVVEIADPQQ